MAEASHWLIKFPKCTANCGTDRPSCRLYLHSQKHLLPISDAVPESVAGGKAAKCGTFARQWPNLGQDIAENAHFNERTLEFYVLRTSVVRQPSKTAIRRFRNDVYEGLWSG